MAAPIAAATAHSVLLATSWAPLLSGRLDQCFHADDPSCRGGVAAFRAVLRHHQGIDLVGGPDDIGDGEDAPLPAAHLQLLDRNNAFVHMHPLGLAVNRLILHDLMDLDVVASSPSVLLQNSLDYEVSSRDISALQTRDMPLLLSNVNVPPQNSWHEYTDAVYFHEETGLAVLSVSNTDEELTVPQVESASGSLRYVRRVNEENGCVTSAQEKRGEYLGRSREIIGEVSGAATEVDPDPEESFAVPGPEPRQCWLPVVYHSVVHAAEFLAFLEGMLDLPEEYRPALLIDTTGHVTEYETPQRVGDIWVASHGFDSRGYFHHRLDVSYGTSSSGDGLPRLENVEFLHAPLSPLPEEYKDETYRREIVALREVADEALENNPALGYTGFMPVARDSSRYRPCKSGECPIGNLFTDAARWYAQADVAFITSGGVRGPGWPAGEVKVSNVWAALPFPNNLCTGHINGVHLFQLLNYSMSAATFEGEDTDDGGRLLQVSGMRVTYNTQLNHSRIVTINILDRETNQFEPIERLKMYKFATDSFLCDVYRPFPDFLGEDALVAEGEEPGRIEPVLYQEMLASFLTATTTIDVPHFTKTQGRLANDTATTEALDLVETEEGCAPGMYWKGDIETCLSCPTDFDVTFSKQAVEFEISSREEAPGDLVSLKNHERFPLAVVPKRLPEWLSFDSVEKDSLHTLGPGESLHLKMEVSPSELEEGTVYVTIGFGVLDGGEGDYRGCIGQDATFDVTMRVMPAQELNHLGPIRAVGFALFGLIAIASLSFAAFVFHYRKQKVVRALQPIFLLTICFGVLVMGAGLLTLSVDDEVASQRGCDVKCMALPWLLSMGFSFSISALFAKLWRVNRVLNGRAFRRVEVHAKDVALPLVVLLLLNFIVLQAWSFIDPLVWKRFEVDGEAWKSYGVCIGANEEALNPFILLLGVLNISALGLAIAQAWRARNISDEYSETKIAGIALFGWLQVLLVGMPVLFMIDRHDTTTRYFLMSALISLMCLSMLLVLFVPLFKQVRRARERQRVQTNCGGDRFSGNTNSKVTTPKISGLNCNLSAQAEVRRGNSGSNSSAPRISGLHYNLSTPIDDQREPRKGLHGQESNRNEHNVEV